MASAGDMSRGPVLLSISMGTVSFAFATVVIRFCVRTRVSRNLGMDDYAIVVAAVVAFVATILSILEGAATDSTRALMFDYLGQPWFLMGSTIAKISICLFFIRLVGGVRQWVILLVSQLVLIAVLNLAFAVTTNAQCAPVSKLWNPSERGTCWDPSVEKVIGIVQGAFSVFWWLFLSLFPVMIVRDLDMHRRMRWPFYFLSSLSLIAAVFASVRTYEVSQTTRSVYSFDSFFSTVLAILEQNVGIVAANVLPLGPLFSRRQRAEARAESRAAGSMASGRRSARDSLKTPSLLIIQGTGKDSFDEAASSRPIIDSRGSDRAPSRQQQQQQHGRGGSGSRAGSRQGDYQHRAGTRGSRDMGSRQSNRAHQRDHHHRRGSSDLSSLGGGGGGGASDWPRGIIKTVEVEVVEEDLADINRAHLLPERGASRMSAFSFDQDWANMLRLGPSGTPEPGSRGPSRQA